MKVLEVIGKEFKKVFEGNQCRFADGCELYQVPKKCPNCKGIGKEPALRDWIPTKPDEEPISAGIINPTLVKCYKCNGVGLIRGVLCNNYFERFLEDGKVYCRKYPKR